MDRRSDIATVSMGSIGVTAGCAGAVMAHAWPMRFVGASLCVGNAFFVYLAAHRLGWGRL